MCRRKHKKIDLKGPLWEEHKVITNDMIDKLSNNIMLMPNA